MKNILDVIAIIAIACSMVIVECAAVSWTGLSMIHMIIHGLLLISLAKRLWK